MHPAVLGIAIGTQLLTQVSDRVPSLDVAATCKATVADDIAMGVSLPQTYETCMADENRAQQQLGPIWSSYSTSVQAQCTSEATAAGADSYVELLVCLQMNDTTRSMPVTDLKGARRKKPAN